MQKFRYCARHRFTGHTVIEYCRIAALIGAGGLGGAVMRSLATVDIGKGFESGLGIVILAMLLDRIIRVE